MPRKTVEQLMVNELGKSFRVKIDVFDDGIFVGIADYEEKWGDSETSRVVMVDFFDEQPEVIVWSDIARDDPTHRISLEMAHISHREEEE